MICRRSAREMVTAAGGAGPPGPGLIPGWRGDGAADASGGDARIQRAVLQRLLSCATVSRSRQNIEAGSGVPSAAASR